MAKTEFKTTFSIDDKASSPLSKIIESLQSLDKGSDKALESLNELTRTNFTPIKNSLTTVTKTMTDSTGKTTQLTREIKNLESQTAPVKNLANSVGQIGTKANSANSALSKIKGAALSKVKGIADQVKDSLNGVKNESEQTESKLGGLAKSIISIGTAYTAIAGIKKAMNWSDEISNTNSRLNMVVNSFNELNGSTENLDQFKDSIFQAAQSSRSSYSTMQNMVASLGQQTKGVFGSTDDIINFSRVLNLGFKAAGTGAQQADAAMLQLTQALTSGRLQGDELVSLRENASFLVNTMAEGLGVTTEQFFEMASAGEITSDKVVSSIMNMQGKITEQASQIKYTFSDVWTEISNSTTHAFEPIANELGQLANSPEFLSSMDQLQAKITELAPKIKDLVSGIVSAAPDVLEKLVDGFSWIVDHGSELGNVIVTLGVAFGTLSIISNIAGMMSALGVAITIPLAPIALVIAAIAGVVAGVVWLWNTNDGFRNFIIGCWDAIKQTFQDGWNKIQDAMTGIGYAWDELVNVVSNAWNNVANTVSNWWNEAISWGTNVIEGFRQGLVNAWNNVTSWFTGAWDWVVDKVKSAFQIGSPSKVFEGIGGDMLQGFLGGLQTMWTNVTSWFSSAWDGLKDTVSSIWSKLFGGEDKNTAPSVDYTATIESARVQLQQLQATVAEGFNNIMSQIGSTMVAITGQVIAGLQTLISQIAPTISSVIPYIQTVYNQFLVQTSLTLQALKSTTILQTQDMVAQMGASVGGLNSVFMQAFSLISTQTLQILISLNASSVAILTNLSNTANSIMEHTRNNMINTVTAMANTVIQLYSTLATQSILIVSQMASSLIQDYTNLVNNLIKLMNNLCTQVLGIVQRFVNNIKTTVGTLPGYFYNIGSSMMNSLRQGIENSRSGVISTTSSLVQQLKNTFEGGLGIHSPSDYMIWIGQMMLAGLIQGMSSSQIQKFIENMIGDMQTSFESGKFNANELVNFLSDSATLNLIGKITGMDLKNMNPEQIAYPLIGTLGTQTSWFGHRESPGGIGSTNHQGADLAAPTGTGIAAALGGTVTTADWYGGYGQAVVIDSGNGLSIVYGHMSQILAQQGQSVAKGSQIGLVGSTGNSTGPHLHFEMRNNGVAFDPQPYLEGAGISAGNTLANAIQQAYNLKHGIVTVGSSSMGNVAFDVSAGASQWSSVVLQALSMLGQPASLLQGVLYAIDAESGGNPNAINLWDSNSATDPSRGLLQTIGATFEAYRNPSLSSNIYDPLANVYAALNYMIQRYGSVANVINPRMGGWYGYDVGTRYVPADMPAVVHKGEAIIPASQNPYSQSGGDYLGDMIANAAPQTGNVGATVSVGNINTTVNVSGATAENPEKLADVVSEEILRKLELAMSTKAGVRVGY